MDGHVGLGYDAGGNGRHGVAVVTGDDKPHLQCVNCVQHANSAVGWLGNHLKGHDPARTALGVDTLTAWAMGRSGDRPADERLRSAYKEKARSVIYPNSLYSAMTVNGMAVVLKLRENHQGLAVTEVHPGVLKHALALDRNGDDELPRLHKGACDIVTGQSDWAHVRDAVTCAYAAWRVASGAWNHDLHDEERALLVSPLERPHFYWPCDPRERAA